MKALKERDHTFWGIMRRLTCQLLGLATCFFITGCSSPAPKDTPQPPPSTKAPKGTQKEDKSPAKGETELGAKGVFPGEGNEGED